MNIHSREAAMTELGEKLIQIIAEGFERDVSDGSKRLVILTAMEQFGRKGVAATRISDIAQAGGFSQGFVYRYFKSKDEIFTHIVDLAARGAENTVKAAAALDAPPLNRIRALAEAMLDAGSLAMKHWRLILLQAAASEGIPEEAAVLSRAAAPKPIEALIPVIREGQRQGQISGADPLMLSITFFSIMQGLGITRVQAQGPLPMPPVDMILRFLRPDREENP